MLVAHSESHSCIDLMVNTPWQDGGGSREGVEHEVGLSKVNCQSPEFKTVWAVTIVCPPDASSDASCCLPCSAEGGDTVSLQIFTRWD